MSAESNSKVLAFVECASKAIEVGTKIANAQAAKDAAVSQLVPGLVQQLKTAGLLDETEVKAAEAQLADPVGALEIFGNLLGIHAKQAAAHKEASVSRLGAAEAGMGGGRVKVASTEDNYVGRRRGSADEMSESDKCLMSLVPGFTG